MKTKDSLYVVQKILAHRENQTGRFEYKIKWKGFPQSQSTWEPYNHLTQIQQMVKQYYQQHEVKRISQAVWPVPDRKKNQQTQKRKKEKMQKKEKKLQKLMKKQKNKQKTIPQINKEREASQQQAKKFPKLSKLLQNSKQKQFKNIEFGQKQPRQAKKLASKKIKNAINIQKPKKHKKIKKNWRQVDNCVFLDSSGQQKELQLGEVDQSKIIRKLNMDSEQENIEHQNKNKKAKYPSTSIDNKQQQEEVKQPQPQPQPQSQSQSHQQPQNYNQNYNQSEQSSSINSSSLSSNYSSSSSEHFSRVKIKNTKKWAISYYPHQQPPTINIQKIKEGNIFKDQIKKIDDIRKQNGEWKVLVIWKNSKLQLRWVNRNIVRLIRPHLLQKFYTNLHQNSNRQNIRSIRNNEVITNQKTNKKWIF